MSEVLWVFYDHEGRFERQERCETVWFLEPTVVKEYGKRYKIVGRVGRVAKILKAESPDV